jgi:serine/threonine-protein kinase
MALALSRGSTLGNYEVSVLLGKGGMGEVWRASDRLLGRDIAIKTLPTEFSEDVDRLSRFEREAKVLASLNHPNIASIYGLEASAGTKFLVLELVEGDTLADLIKRGPLSVAEAIRLSLQIAEAIEAAHEKDVIHRDLKPANIKVTPEGKVKVLDFGLAKALQAEAGDVANSPTLSMAATAHGIILGTAAYMAPEQARGQAVDRRADIWAFGCVLYEMLTGRQAFRGEMVSDILASVLAREPDFAELPPTIPPRLREALQRCLEKSPRKRWQAIGDLRVELERILANPTEGSAPVADASPAAKANWKMVLPYVAAGALVAAATWALKPAPTPEPRPLVRFDYEVPLTPAFRGTGRPVVAFSPDGRYFAYNTADGVYLRAMDALTSRLIPGTEVATTSPFFSPDGEWLAFWSNDATALQKISIAGGVPVTIGPATNPFGASWGRDGQILFAQPDGIKRVSSDGGTPELVIASKQGEAMYGPSLLPDGKTILYSLTRAAGPTRWDQAEVIAQQPGGEPKVLVRGGSDAVYVPSGHLAYAVGAVLYAIAFDLARLETRGGPVAIVNGVQRTTAPAANTASANFGLSEQGTLVYLNAVPAAAIPESTLGVVDRDGKIRMLEVPRGNYRNPRVSPNGRSVAVETLTPGGQNVIWVYDLSGTSAIRRLTQEGNATRPVWTPDGKRIAFGSIPDKEAGIFWQPADGSGLPERLTTAESGFQHYPESFSPDGKALSFATVRVPLGQGSWSLWTLRLDGSEKKPQLFYDVPTSNEFGASFSPDGKWIAYASNAGPDANSPPTTFAIYLQPYPPTGVKYEISQSGGAWPIWGPNGRELLYRLNVTEGNVPKLNAVTISTQPVPAFTGEKVLPIQGFLPVINNREYDILPNGRELVMVFPAARSVATAPATARIHTVLNWTEELKARVPVK